MPSTPRTILLTGCSRGLGAALTRYFLDAGHTLLGCARSAERIDALRSEHRHLESTRCRFDAVDVADDAAVQHWAGEVLSSHPAPDLLINNAGVINRLAPLWEVSAAEFRQVLAVNVEGAANLIRHFVPAMAERGSGVIVNLSSGWGRSTSPDVGPYCTSKWAVEGMTQALSQELPSGLAAVALNPGVIDTDMLQSCFGSSASSYPTPEIWVKKAGPMILSLDAKDNGRALSVG